jgi:4-amino-4-deoxy-L-arabinose transferase-like glycosyltransferase
MEFQVRKKNRKNIGDWQKVGDIWVLMLIIIFFFAFLPLLPSTAKYHGDEVFYTDAAIHMVQTGDYFTPHYYDGALQLRKPIVAYWAVVASYKILGINLFSSRIPFLIAGCLIIWFTYKLALLFFRRQDFSIIAAAIMASNLTLFHVSVRSTPDTFFCLFMSISLYGFANLIFNRDKRMVNYIFAYVGAGLAVATHGPWGALPVIFSFLFCFSRKKDTVKLRELIDVKSIVIAVVVASFWYVIAWYQHGNVFIQHFFGDEIADRWSGFNMYNIVKNMLTYLLALVRQFLPWSVILLLVVVRNKNNVINFFREHKKVFLFVIGWYLTFFVIFSFISVQRARYFLSTYPPISALYAALFVTIAGSEISSSLFCKIERGIILACLLGGCLLALAGLFIDIRLVVGGLISIFVTAVLYAFLSRRSAVFGLVTVALCTILAYSVAENFISPVIYDSPALQVVKKVREYTQAPIEITELGLLPTYFASQIYVLSGGSIKVYHLGGSIIPERKQFQFIILSEPFKEQLNLDGYAVEECGYSYVGRFPVRSLWSIRKIADFRALLSRFKQHYYLVIMSESSQHRSHS